MDSRTAANLLTKVRALREKQAEMPALPPDPAQAAMAALQARATQDMQMDALRDVRNVGLLALGTGIAGRSAMGLAGLLQKNLKPKKQKTGPALLPLPYPVDTKTAGVLDTVLGSDATTKGGIPAYAPAMALVGLGGLGLGWKGTDMLLNQRRKAENEDELARAREDFHDALISQYVSPRQAIPGAKVKQRPKFAADDTMVKVGEALDQLFDVFAAKLTKQADVPNALGQAAGGYGVYAGLTGLLSGAVIYDKMQKRSQRAILEKAMQRRARRRFMQAPTEIYATPEPIEHIAPPPLKDSMQLIGQQPDEA